MKDKVELSETQKHTFISTFLELFGIKNKVTLAEYKTKAGETITVDDETKKVEGEVKDGEYELEDGKVLVIAEGMISEIKDAPVEEKEAEEAPVEESKPDEVQAQIDELKAWCEKLQKQVDEMSAAGTKLKEVEVKLAEAESKIEKIENEPADKKTNLNLNAQVDTKKLSVAERAILMLKK